ncbi:uncharacterized protein BJX67DRAFT_381799 [Aspergillus lucknowensis]|uniref:Uncharacterized protein n=1 Tax=Aspergillus lucknowensis TaxID=176173 RepID=A0ABR4LPV6_9EURO
MVPSWGNYVHESDNSRSVINAQTVFPFGKFIGQRYPYLPKTLVGDSIPYWQNKTAVKNDSAIGGAVPDHQVIDWSFVYDDLANGILVGERAAIASTSSTNHTSS